MTVVLETVPTSGAPQVEIWRRGNATPHRFTQQFSLSGDADCMKKAFMDELPVRLFGRTLFLACGETNIISTQRDSDELTDPFRFMEWLDRAAPHVILNPSHDYMVRPEMKTKRALFSGRGRVVLSVWNRGYMQSEACDPWLAFFDGNDVTGVIVEVPMPSTPEVRVGVFDVSKVPASAR